MMKINSSDPALIQSMETHPSLGFAYLLHSLLVTVSEARTGGQDDGGSEPDAPRANKGFGLG